MRTDKAGRDVTGLTGLWDESDSLNVSLRVYKPTHPPDAWFGLMIAVGGNEYRIGGESVCEADCRMEGEQIVKDFAALGVSVQHDGIYEYA